MSHDISCTLPEHSLGKVDAIFKVKKNGEVLGTLKISKGSLDWTPRGHELENPYQLNWTKFDKLIQGNGRRKR